MLDFISKIFKRQSETKHQSNNIKLQNESNVSKAELEEKHNQQAHERVDMMKKINDLSHNELALIDLVLQCEFSDGRLQAAQFIYSKNALEKIKDAMRNTDKRVVKLMQKRLDIIDQSEKDEKEARQLISQAEQLLKQDCLLLNQVIDLDKQVKSLTQFPDVLHQAYSQVREQLEQQLAVQQSLQRRLLDVSKKLEWNNDEFIQENSSELEKQWQECQIEIDAVSSHEKAYSVPKNLLSSVKLLLQNQFIKLKKISQQQKTDSFKSEHIDDTKNSAQHKIITNQSITTKSLFDTSQFELILKQFETALENGSMQNSRQFDRELKGIKLDQSAISTSQKDRLQLARSSFIQMQSLAKWSSDVSRNELIETAEGLAALNLNAKEIVSTVKALRQQWKQLEITSGGTSKELWDKFDQLCNTVYAPAAQHFQEVDEQRKSNLIKAEHALISMKNQAELMLSVNEKLINWKQVQQLIQQFQQDWKTWNDFDKQQQVKMNLKFDELLASLRIPLIHRQREELFLREQLIEQANLIDASQRNALDQIRLLQESWHSQARNVPLRRQDEQNLWDKFRAACDTVFQKRKQLSESADTQRQDNLQLKIQICERLEQAILIENVEINESIQLIKKIANEWKTVGAIPREQDAAIEKRYLVAVHAINNNINFLREKEKKIHNELLLKKISICQALELLLVSTENNEEVKQDQKQKIEEEWSQVTSLTASSNNKNQLRFALDERYKLGQQALSDMEFDNSILIQKNLLSFDEILLHLEILNGVDSPERLSRERLQKQVEVLQLSMKNGQSENNLLNLTSELIAIPVILDMERKQRLTVVLTHLS
jgi:exonuclease SbcC